MDFTLNHNRLEVLFVLARNQIFFFYCSSISSSIIVFLLIDSAYTIE